MEEIPKPFSTVIKKRWEEMLIVGVDGGASSTKCLVVNEIGHVMSYAQGPPLYLFPGQRGVSLCRTVFKELLRRTFPKERHPTLQQYQGNVRNTFKILEDDRRRS